MGTILAVLKFLSDLWSVVSSAIRAWRQAKKENWIIEHDSVHEAIRNAKTDEERRELAKRLAESIRNTP